MKVGTVLGGTASEVVLRWRRDCGTPVIGTVLEASGVAAVDGGTDGVLVDVKKDPMCAAQSSAFCNAVGSKWSNMGSNIQIMGRINMKQAVGAATAGFQCTI